MKPISRNTFIILYERQKGMCEYCGGSLLEEAQNHKCPTVDHIIPKHKNGINALSNLCLSCRWCNNVKGKKDVGEFLEYIKPYLEGKVSKKALRGYHLYKELQKQFPDERA